MIEGAQPFSVFQQELKLPWLLLPSKIADSYNQKGHGRESRVLFDSSETIVNPQLCCFFEQCPAARRIRPPLYGLQDAVC